MRYIKLKNVKKGQIVAEGEIGVGKFAVAEVEDVIIHIKNIRGIDMDKGVIEKYKDSKNSLYDYKRVEILNLEEIKKIKQIENKIKMLENLKDVKGGKK